MTGIDDDWELNTVTMHVWQLKKKNFLWSSKNALKLFGRHKIDLSLLKKIWSSYKEV